MIGGFPKRVWRGLPWALCVAALCGGGEAGVASEAILPPAPVIAPTPAAPVAAAPAARTAYAYPVAPTAAVMAASFYGMEEAPRGNALLRQAMLDAHNDERAALRLAPLAWDDALAADAARYAEEMARTGAYRHSARASRTIPSGENLWMGPRRLSSYQVMAQAFLNEKADFIPTAKLPDFSRTGHWQQVAHYTQMIWRGTQKVGCALGEGRDYDYLVCRYFPAGNAFGKGPFDADEATLAMASPGEGPR
ncbi:CAP domain-containing protein [Sphingobium amiense]|nr:CAP domain-containing protein [Sphingobium amiense]